MYQYPLELHTEPIGVWLSCPGIPEMKASGDTLGEAFVEALMVLSRRCCCCCCCCKLSRRARFLPILSRATLRCCFIIVQEIVVFVVAIENVRMKTLIGKHQRG